MPVPVPLRPDIYLRASLGFCLKLLKILLKGHTPQEYMIASLILSQLSAAEYSVFELLMGKDLKLQSSPKPFPTRRIIF